MKLLSDTDILSILDKSPQGKNTKFLSAAHSLWFRFKNYEKCPPVGLEVDGDIVCIIFATFNRDKSCNLYEIVTIEGKEKNGYASKLWKEFIDFAVNEKGMQRLKLSCTTSSIGWHLRNGLVFWAIDPSGSLRSEQKLFSTVEDQLNYRELCVQSPRKYLPPEKLQQQYRNEGLDTYSFGEKKKTRIVEAINQVGEYWLYNALFTETNLDSFYD